MPCLVSNCNIDPAPPVLLTGGGGIRKVHEKYIGNFQHTPYFQKFNVHPGSSSNFWGQYMQDISGALIGGHRGYSDYLDTGNLEAAHRFVKSQCSIFCKTHMLCISAFLFAI